MDYGDSATVNKHSLRVLPDKWMHLPALAFPIKVLNDVPSVDNIVVIELGSCLRRAYCKKPGLQTGKPKPKPKHKHKHCSI